jgi:hypothetical protein
MYDDLISSSGTLNDQIARQLFSVLPEDGPLLAIIDDQGNYWPSESNRFSQLNIDEQMLKQLCSRIDDGAEPVITQINDFGIVAVQLATERTNCGYVVLVMPKYTPESILANIELIEILLSQVGLIARLVEQNNHLYRLQMKQFNLAAQSTPS